MELLETIKCGNFEEVKNLLKSKKININYQTHEEKLTPLIYASLHGQTQIVQLLLYYNANTQLKTKIGFSALTSAACNGHLEIVRLLLWKQNESSSYKSNSSIVWDATDINHQTNDGWTALMGAAFNGHEEMVRYLLEQGAFTGLRNKSNKTAFDLSKTENIKNLVSLSTYCSSSNSTDRSTMASNSVDDTCPMEEKKYDIINNSDKHHSLPNTITTRRATLKKKEVPSSVSESFDDVGSSSELSVPVNPTSPTTISEINEFPKIQESITPIHLKPIIPLHSIIDSKGISPGKEQSPNSIVHQRILAIHAQQSQNTQARNLSNSPTVVNFNQRQQETPSNILTPVPPVGASSHFKSSNYYVQIGTPSTPKENSVNGLQQKSRVTQTTTNPLMQENDSLDAGNHQIARSYSVSYKVQPNAEPVSTFLTPDNTNQFNKKTPPSKTVYQKKLTPSPVYFPSTKPSYSTIVSTSQPPTTPVNTNESSMIHPRFSTSSTESIPFNELKDDLKKLYHQHTQLECLLSQTLDEIKKLHKKIDDFEKKGSQSHNA